MSRNGHCAHLDILQLSLSELYNVKQGYPCAQCDAKGRNLWICLYHTCMNIGCSEHDNDHGTKHYRANPAHCLQLNLSTRRIWCYVCNKEVFVHGADAKDGRRRISVGGSSSGGSSNSGTSSTYDQQLRRGESPSNNDSDSDDDEVNERGDEDATLSGGSYESGLIGLKNIANTCYMNAALQALSNAPPLHGYFMDCGDIVEATGELHAQQQHQQNQYHNHQQKQRRAGLARSYHRLVKDMWSRRRRGTSFNGGGGYIIPSGILNGIRSVHPMFRGYQQHDTQEFLRCFMDQLHDELKEPTPAPPDAYLRHLPDEPADYMDDRSQCSSPTQSLSEAEYETCDSGVSEQSSLSEEHIEDQQQHQQQAQSQSQSQSQPPPRPNQQRQHRPTAQQQPSSSPMLSFRRYAPPSRPNSPSAASGYYSSTSSTYQRQAHHAKQAGPSSGGGGGSSAGGDEISSSTASCSQQHEVVNPKPKPLSQRSIISDVFDGKLLSSVQCLTCDRVSTREETFQDLSLPIPGKDHLSALHHQQTAAAAAVATPPSPSHHSTPTTPGSTSTGASLGSAMSASVTSLSSAGAEAAYQLAQASWLWWLLHWLRSFFWGPAVSLYDCMAAFFSADELKGDNMYSCERCKKLRNGIKFSRVLQLPEMLCVHLKRFRHDLSYSSKITAPVHFPLHGLDMSAYLHRDCRSRVSVFDLSAVICHHGTVGGGHYTSYARHPRNGRWYEYDDQLVTQVPEETVAGCEAYVLFYRKCNAHMAEWRQQAMGLLDECAPMDGIGVGGSRGGAAEGGAGASDLRFFVSKQWLNKFNTFAEPGPIDNWALLCAHGALPPGKAAIKGQLVVALPQPLWEFFYRRFGGGPVINQLYECESCRRAAEAMQRRQQSEMMAFQRYKDETTATLYAISMMWLRQWQAFVAGVGDDGDFGDAQPPGPIANAAIAGQLEERAGGGGSGGKQPTVLRSVRAGSDYAQVNSSLWHYFHGVYGGGPTIVMRGMPEVEDDVAVEEDEEYKWNGGDEVHQLKQGESDSRVRSGECVQEAEDEDAMKAERIGVDVVGENASEVEHVIVEISAQIAVEETAAMPLELTMLQRGNKVVKNVSFEDDAAIPVNAVSISGTSAAVAQTSPTSLIMMTPSSPAHHYDEADNESLSSLSSSTTISNVAATSSSATNGGGTQQHRRSHNKYADQQHQPHNRQEIVSKRDKRHRGGITSNGMFGLEGKYSATPLGDNHEQISNTRHHHQQSGTTPHPQITPFNDVSAFLLSPTPKNGATKLNDVNGQQSQPANGEGDQANVTTANIIVNNAALNNTTSTAAATPKIHVPATMNLRKGQKLRKKLKSKASSASRNKQQLPQQQTSSGP